MRTLRAIRLAGRTGRVGARAGFALLEVVLALVLISLIAALALPRGSGTESATSLRIKTFELVALLRSDRDAALAGGRTVVSLIDLDRRLVRSGASGRVVTLSGRMAIRVSAGLAGGIRFLPDGTATGGEIFLARPGLGAVVSVRIDDLTAAVAVDDGDLRYGGRHDG